MPTSTTSRAFADATVRADTEKAKLGASAGLQVLGGPTNKQRIAYLRAVPPVPAGALIASATLRLYQASASTGNRTLSLRRVAGPWLEGVITWLNRPPRSTVSDTKAVNGVGTVGRMVEFDVKTEVQEWVDGAVNHGWALESSTANLITFYAKDSSVRRPELVVEWSIPPGPPVDLQPAGGRATTDPKPTLRWTYATTDNQATTLAAARVHLKTTNTGWTAADGYAEPTFDTGNVPTTIAQLDLAATAWAGLSANNLIWYSVSQCDSAGQWSAWSDPQRFSYAPPTPATITTPASGGTVTDLAFPVAWSVTEQIAYRLILTDPDDGRELYDTGRVPSGTARLAYVDRGPRAALALRTARPGQRLRVALRTWDRSDRTPAPGAPEYAETVVEVTYADSPDTAPVQGLTATASADRPTTVLTWTRATAPDLFGIWVDGREVDLVEPADVRGDPGLWTYAIAVAGPHEVTIKALDLVTVDGIQRTRASAANPVAAIERDLFAVWLIVPEDPSRDIRFLSENDENIVSTTMPEVTSLFEPAGGSTVIPVTTALRWFEGTLTGGVLADYGDLDAETLRTRLLRAKGDRLRPYQLMWGTRSVPVWIRDVNIEDDNIPGVARYLVSFEFNAAVPSPEYALT